MRQVSIHICLRLIILVVFTLLFAKLQGNVYNPFLKKQEEVIKPPTSTDDAIRQLKLVLKDEILNHFKTDGKVTGTIKISQELANFFINHWELINNAPVNSAWGIDKPDNFLNDYSPIVEEFSRYQIQNPQIILRILFSCLYEDLNHETFSLSKEIEDYKNTNSLWDLSLRKRSDYYKSVERLESIEADIIKKSQYELFNVGDTIGCRYYEGKRGSLFYISAVILKTEANSEDAQINIFDITSNRRYRVAFLGDKLIKQGETSLIKEVIWQKANENEFNYYYGDYSSPVTSEWSEYLKKKKHAE